VQLLLARIDAELEQHDVDVSARNGDDAIGLLTSSPDLL
jgi:hypothetical protein